MHFLMRYLGLFLLFGVDMMDSCDEMCTGSVLNKGGIFWERSKITKQDGGKSTRFTFTKQSDDCIYNIQPKKKGILQLSFFVLLLVSLKRALKYIKTYVQYAGFQH